MKKWIPTYKSMTAYYKFKPIYAETKEEAEREARANATAFTKGERTLIKCIEAKD